MLWNILGLSRYYEDSTFVRISYQEIENLIRIVLLNEDFTEKARLSQSSHYGSMMSSKPSTLFFLFLCNFECVSFCSLVIWLIVLRQLSYLFKMKMYWLFHFKGKFTERGIHLLAHFPNGHHVWAEQIWNQEVAVSYGSPMCMQDSRLWVIFHCFPSPLAGTVSEAEQLVHELVPIWNAGNVTWRVRLLSHRTSFCNSTWYYILI